MGPIAREGVAIQIHHTGVAQDMDRCLRVGDEAVHVDTTGNRLIEKRQVGSIIGQVRDQRDNTVQTAHRSGNAKSR